MIKKVIIFLFVFAFLSSVITPNFVLAGVGEAQPISTGEALAWSAGFLVVILGIPYLIKKSKEKDLEEQVSSFIKPIRRNISPTGEIVLFRF